MFPSMDTRTFEVGTFEDEPDDLSYWLSRPPAERLAGIEFLRRQCFDFEAAARELRRFIEIGEFPPSTR